VLPPRRAASAYGGTLVLATNSGGTRGPSPVLGSPSPVHASKVGAILK
jgi:hypothetical protein